MKINKQNILIWGFGLLSAGVFIFAITVDGFQSDPDIFLPMALAYIIIGCLIASRQPNNAIGWLFLVGMFILSVNEAMRSYVKMGFQEMPLSLPNTNLVAAFTNPLEYIGYVLLLIFSFLLFPNGRLISRRWLPILWFAVLVLVLQFIEIFRPGPIVNFPSLENPLGIEQLAGYYEFSGILNEIITIALFASCPIYLIIRYRWASKIERQQIKWFVFAGSIVSAGIFILAVFPEMEGTTLLGNVIGLIVLSSLPFAIAIAILRYNLFDIDLIIRRTLQYTIVTAMLVLVYFGSILILENLIVAITGQESPIVIVISTLMIAFLFNPIRIRVQDFIDHRFNRKKFNTDQALRQFAAVTRDEVRMDNINTAFLTVVEETIQPDAISLWIINVNR